MDSTKKGILLNVCLNLLEAHLMRKVDLLFSSSDHFLCDMQNCMVEMCDEYCRLIDKELGNDGTALQVLCQINVFFLFNFLTEPVTSELL